MSMSTPLDTPLAAPDLEELGSVLTEERTSGFDDGDHEKFAHYVEKGQNRGECRYRVAGYRPVWQEMVPKS